MEPPRGAVELTKRFFFTVAGFLVLASLVFLASEHFFPDHLWLKVLVFGAALIINTAISLYVQAAGDDVAHQARVFLGRYSSRPLIRAEVGADVQFPYLDKTQALRAVQRAIGGKLHSKGARWEGEVMLKGEPVAICLKLEERRAGSFNDDTGLDSDVRVCRTGRLALIYERPTVRTLPHVLSRLNGALNEFDIRLKKNEGIFLLERLAAVEVPAWTPELTLLTSGSEAAGGIQAHLRIAEKEVQAFGALDEETFAQLRDIVVTESVRAA